MKSRRWGERATRRIACAVAAVLLGAMPRPGAAQQDTTAFYRALELEGAGKYRDAAPLFRASLRSESAVSALLGLERVYAELGWTDSLVTAVDSLVTRQPDEPVFRSVQLRTLQTLGRDRELREAIQRWIAHAPRDPAPYREYARLLLQRGLTASADSVIRSAGMALGSTADLQLESAQVHAANGRWVASAEAWRLALLSSPYLEQAAVYALAPTPTAVRDSVRQALLATPLLLPVRRALAGLEMTWGSPSNGWRALADLPVDSASADAWTEFATRAEGEERWTLARDALVAAMRWRRTPELTTRAATAALRAGDPAMVLQILPLNNAGDARVDSARMATTVVPIQARALAMLGRPSLAERLVERYDRWIPPALHVALTRAIALGWVRSGDLARARASLTATGAEGDSSDAAGWLALYEGDLATARRLLRTSTEATPELATALAIVARVRADSAPTLGRAFLLLARADTLGAAGAFLEAAERRREASSILVATAARLHAATGDQARARTLWKRIVDEYALTPEAPAAELDWARQLRASGDAAGAVAHLEHLILTYPQSALVPQARRELELARHAIPGAA